LLSILLTYNLNTDTAELIIWGLHSSGLFTINFMYIFLNFKGVKVSLAGTIWKLKIPLKIKLFIWLDLYDKILTKDVLARNGCKKQ
jgi:zinc-binding in reverse transcriptase